MKPKGALNPLIFYVSRKHCAHPHHEMSYRCQLKDIIAFYHRNISKNQKYFRGILLFVRKNLRNGVKIFENDKNDKLCIQLKKRFVWPRGYSYLFCIHTSSLLGIY